MTPDDAGERRSPWLPVNGPDPADEASPGEASPATAELPAFMAPSFAPAVTPEPAAASATPVTPAPATPAPPAAPAAPANLGPDLTPAKPIVPSWIIREVVPTPIEAESVDVLAPIVAPPAQEMLPSAGDFGPTAPPVSPYDNPDVRRGATVDAVQQLGAGAVASATLSAAGAPTPLGGVPTVASPDAAPPPSFGESSPLFTPRFEYPPQSPVSGLEQSVLEANAGVEYQPRYEPSAPVSEDGEADGDEPRRRRGLLWLWIVLAVLALAAGAWLLWATVLKPEPVTVPGAVVTLGPPQPTLEPVAIASPTPLLSAMPATVATYALTGAESLAPAAVAAEHGRVAEAAALTYSNGVDDVTVTVLQYFDEDAATAAWTAIVGEDVAGEPVTAGGAEVGRVATTTQPTPSIVWRNGTTVLIASGPAVELQGFHEAFGL